MLHSCTSTLHYIHYITLHYITLHYITLHYIALHYFHCISLHFVASHHITPHYSGVCIHTKVNTHMMRTQRLEWQIGQDFPASEYGEHFRRNECSNRAQVVPCRLRRRFCSCCCKPPFRMEDRDSGVGVLPEYRVEASFEAPYCYTQRKKAP